MKTYALDIQYPINVEGETSESLEHLLELDILEKLNHFKWWQYRTLQLQLSGIKTSMTIVDEDEQHMIKLYLLDNSRTGEIELAVKTNIDVVTSKKELFGLMTRKVAEPVMFDRISLNQAKTLIKDFLYNQIDEIQATYLLLKTSKVAA